MLTLRELVGGERLPVEEHAVRSAYPPLAVHQHRTEIREIVEQCFDPLVNGAASYFDFVPESREAKQIARKFELHGPPSIAK